ncbi:hypothetical protein [Paracoccus yeei]|uniref:Uncharacterized protein n=1 Tax=Paracoccus yeei TaxID=147645 RepID=A0A5P2QVB2_9RHOB|nr:hypothetical protein [Paracoccus yeei]MBY0138415.1 hypothetical protein [Paracoccus yeei]QEU10048.1 hypothetical protein FOB51_19690 [Paracoccus yeei]
MMPAAIGLGIDAGDLVDDAKFSQLGQPLARARVADSQALCHRPGNDHRIFEQHRDDADGIAAFDRGDAVAVFDLERDHPVDGGDGLCRIARYA